MKHRLTSTLAAGILFAGAYAVAGDMQKDQTDMHPKSMKDCMTREKAKNDGWTHDQVKASCMSKMKGAAMDDTNQAEKPSDKTPEK
jgi:hypothetical protein